MGSRMLWGCRGTLVAVAAAAYLAVTASAVAAPLVGSGNLLYHGGPVMTRTVNYLIFWEPPKLQTGKTAVVATTYNSLIKRFFTDEDHSTFTDIPTEYEVSGGPTITNSATLGGSWVDKHPYPASGCSDSRTPGNCISQAQIEAEIQSAMKQNSWKAGPTHAFYLFTAKGEGSCLADGTSCALTVYCTYDLTFPRGSKTVIYANMPYVQTITSGCNVDRTPNHDIAADSEINMASAVQMNMITDPLRNAWYDTEGFRIADKCQAQFGNYGYRGGKANQKLNGHFYVLQEEWSNKAGGCIQGD